MPLVKPGYLSVATTGLLYCMVLLAAIGAEGGPLAWPVC